ncbi:MAG: D-tyrosyl-tRNA(Tyr) deacylase [Bacilli bacterium]|nr:D-tyrosyl-tRNA(Tyr) deacylase [Bacilli bacterium]
MRVVIQRVSEASVEVNNSYTNSINKGFMILLGICEGDTNDDLEYIIGKIEKLRIFEDENEKMNLSIKDINGEILLVSQFTLYASTKDGNRPSFTKSMKFDEANKMYEIFKSRLSETGIPFKTGEFGANMKVSLINDGPVTIIVDSKNKE